MEFDKLNWDPCRDRFSQRDIDDYLTAVNLIEAGNASSALPTIRRLAAKDFDPAMHLMAYCLEQGLDGIKQDIDAAVDLYKTAARLGNPGALNDLGVFSFRGMYTEKNLPGALSLFAAAAKKGFLPAIHNLAYMVDLGLGTEPDGTRALQLYQLADSHGYTHSTNALGVYYSSGRHVEPARAIATNYYKRAAQAGNQDAKVNLDRISSIRRAQTPIEELKELRQYARLWLHGFPF